MVTAFIGLMVVLSGCGEGQGASEESLHRPDGIFPFTDVTEAAGLGSFRHQTGAVGEKWMPESMGSGAGFIDYDGDGHLDIVLVTGGVWDEEPGNSVPALSLYRNAGDGTFRDQTVAAGLDGVPAYGFGVTVADVDQDGDDDVYLTTLHKNLYFRNDGGIFTELADEVGIAGPDEWSTCALFLDADRDGHLDLYVCGYVSWTPETDVYCDLGGQKTYCAPEDYLGIHGRYFHNDGAGRFTERTREAGFVTKPGKSLGVAEADFNSDGWPDLIVANDAEANLYYENDGDGTFTEKAILAGVAFDDRGRPRGGMGIDVGDVDGDGQPTIFIGNFSEQSIGVFKQVNPTLFLDRAAASKLAQPSFLTLTFGLFLFDVDFDTDLDLFAANGHIQPDIHIRHDNVTYRQPVQLFVNEGGGTFSEAPPTGLLGRPMVARGAAYGDIDNDGDPDILLTENGGPAHLWRNDLNKPNFLRVALQGTASNRGGVGSRITAWVGPTRMERRIQTGSSYLSASEQIATFGLGDLLHVDSLRVDWSSGTSQLFTELSGGQTVLITEGEGLNSRAL